MDDLVGQWLKKHGRLFAGGVPKTIKDAKKRFKCTRLAGDCVLSGDNCASRHVFAIARSQQKTNAADSPIYWAHRDDSACVDCPMGAARAELLEKEPTDWRKAYRIYKRKRNLASIRWSKEAAKNGKDEIEQIEEREEDDRLRKDSIDWPVNARPRTKDWE
tara:strand:- start:707 stop:1189 length:483 start_codon:yes stop_codon:yes gene_type:complete